MKYRIAMVVLLVYAASFLQAAPLSSFRIFGVHMSLPLVLSVVTGLLRGPVESLMMGFLYGLSMDMLMGRTLGLHAVMYAAVAWSLTLVNEKLYREKFLLQSAFAFTATLLTEMLFYLILFLFKGYGATGTVFVQLIMPAALLNGLLILPLYPPLSRAYRRLDEVDRKRNRIGSGVPGRTS